jgi:hypothetical protein
MQDIAYTPTQTLRARIALDDLPETEVVLTAAEPKALHRFKIGPGNHTLRVRIDQPVVNQLLRIKVHERRGNSKTALSKPTQRSYMIATKDQPLVLMLRGPTRLRVDEWRDGHTLSTYRTVKPGWQSVTLTVESDREEALFRVFEQKVTPDKLTAAARTDAHAAVSLGKPLWPQSEAESLPGIALTEIPNKGWLPLGTWSLAGGWVSRRVVDGEPNVSATADRFLKIGAVYRRFSSRQDTYYHADGMLRWRDYGYPTLALNGYVGIRKPHWPVDVDITGSVFIQYLNASGTTEAAATIRGRVSRRMDLSEKLSHRPSLALFQRWLSLDRLPANHPERVDQDVFTRYKQSHQRGLRIGDRIQYRPWLDTILYAGAHANSNEDLNVFDPDNIGVNVGAKQLIGNLDLDINYRHTRYFEDEDRNEANNVNRWRVDLGFSRWLSSSRGLQANLRYEYDQDSADSSIFLTFSFNRSNGRFYQDFRPSDMDFRALRQRRALEQLATTSE